MHAVRCCLRHHPTKSGRRQKSASSNLRALRKDHGQAVLRLLTWYRWQRTRPVSASLNTRPADLTTLAKRHDGKFPREYVAGALRFGPGFSVHGSSGMPVWGPIFQYLDNYDEVAVRQRIKASATIWNLSRNSDGTRFEINIFLRELLTPVRAFALTSAFRA